jgi:hypothetical protein
MVIKIGENPDGNLNRGWNKYIEKDGDGWRGIIVAFKKGHKEAILKGDSRAMSLIHVKEIKPDQYPRVVKAVRAIPKGWEIITPQRIKA